MMKLFKTVYEWNIDKAIAHGNKVYCLDKLKGEDGVTEINSLSVSEYYELMAEVKADKSNRFEIWEIKESEGAEDEKAKSDV